MDHKTVSLFVLPNASFIEYHNTNDNSKQALHCTTRDPI